MQVNDDDDNKLICKKSHMVSVNTDCDDITSENSKYFFGKKSSLQKIETKTEMENEAGDSIERLPIVIVDVAREVVQTYGGGRPYGGRRRGSIAYSIASAHMENKASSSPVSSHEETGGVQPELDCADENRGAWQRGASCTKLLQKFDSVEPSTVTDLIDLTESRGPELCSVEEVASLISEGSQPRLLALGAPVTAVADETGSATNLPPVKVDGRLTYGTSSERDEDISEPKEDEISWFQSLLGRTDLVASKGGVWRRVTSRDLLSAGSPDTRNGMIKNKNKHKDKVKKEKAQRRKERRNANLEEKKGFRTGKKNKKRMVIRDIKDYLRGR